MRTTMNLPDELYRAARIRAAEEGRTVTSIMETALRSFLDSQTMSDEPFRVEPITMGIPGEVPFDVNDNAASREFMDSGDGGSPRAHS